MKLSEVCEVLQLEPILPADGDMEIVAACGADLMSDVLAFSCEKNLLLTGLTNTQVVRTAEMIDLKVIVFVRGKKPPVETIELAKEKNIALYRSARPLYECCGILYENGLKPEKIRKLNGLEE